MCYFQIKKNVLYYLRKLSGDKQIYHQDVMKYLKGVKYPVILEAGAANGYDTLRFAKIFPRATIYAFEPVLKNFKLLKNTVKSCPNVHTFNLALGDFNGTSEMNVSVNSNYSESVATASSLLNPEFHTTLYPDIVFNEKETVNVRIIDSWAAEHKVDKIDVMWLDMQGYEYRALKASPQILKTVKVIYSEVSFKEVFKEGCLYDELKEWLISLGFKVKMEEVVDEGIGNVLFVREKNNYNY